MSFSGREWGKHNTEKKIPNFFFPDYRSRSRFLRPTAITAVSLPSGKGGSEGAMHRAGRDPRPVPESVCATRNAIQTRC